MTAPARPAGSRLPAWLPTLTFTLLRVMVGLLFLQHGLQKLFGAFHDPARPAMPAPAPLSLFWVAGMLETIGGPLVAAGLLTRPVAFLLSGEMAVAYFMMHAPRAFVPALNGGEGVILFCFAFLHLWAVGAGPWSLDALLATVRGARRAPLVARAAPFGTARTHS